MVMRILLGKGLVRSCYKAFKCYTTIWKAKASNKGEK